ncbi:MAG: DPP IV N-terminal domain-containing protein, partial [Muribaculaceae bacterium]|nr:DPP IV N-terminal domain-containing protein [Muribaculaceae bacterium]
SQQRRPVFAPNSRVIAFVGPDNNIYMKKLDYNTEVAVTDDGAVNSVINGVPDWTYEEEFTTDCSMAFSPDSETFCFLRYDEREVPMYTLPVYEGACDPQKEYALYPGEYSYKYPVAGEPNSKVTLRSYDIDERKLADIQLPGSYEYIPRIFYTPEGKVLAVTLNRDQNRMEIYSVSPASKVAKSVFVDESKAWITPETYEDLVLCSDGFIVNSSRSGFASLYKYSYAGALLRTVCEEQADVTACYGEDAAGNIYYQIAAPTPLDRTVRRMDAKGKTACISEASGWNVPDFSSDMSYMVMNHSTATDVPVYTLCRSNGAKVRVLEDNSAYAARVAALPKREFFTLQSDGYTLNGYMIKPEGFNGSGKYPVVMDQYSGPGSQSVCNRWQLDWQQYFAMQGFVVVCVDGRGTGGRGAAFRDAVYRRLGYYETIDQINAARYVAAMPGIDSSRIGICGWSFGGYEALMCATAKDAPYAAACAIAPVTDWRYYDTVYAERYMLTPQQNFEGYEQSAPMGRASSLACPLMIMYGTSDDNVHPANSLEFASALQNAGMLFDMMVFPNMNHSINFCNARAVVYANMLRFFKRELK